MRFKPFAKKSQNSKDGIIFSIDPVIIHYVPPNFDVPVKKKEMASKKIIKVDSKVDQNHKCISCSTTDSILWRRSPDSINFLCNGCGIRLYRLKTFCKHCMYVPRKSEISARKEICPSCLKNMK
eukprot:NODE_130_length_16779_cov_1.687410.p16 type:complete len:124 gc:universal NODE_130_length_16779_cov_1.687410:12314-11943(-)